MSHDQPSRSSGSSSSPCSGAATSSSKGFDFGVGILLPFLGKNEAERRTVVSTLGPVWDGNEVWLLTAGGATFAASPPVRHAVQRLLPRPAHPVALIIRGVAFEFRSKRGTATSPKWRRNWDIAIFIGSFVPALLWGVAFANIVAGVPLSCRTQQRSSPATCSRC